MLSFYYFKSHHVPKNKRHTCCEEVVANYGQDYWVAMGRSLQVSFISVLFCRTHSMPTTPSCSEYGAIYKCLAVILWVTASAGNERLTTGWPLAAPCMFGKESPQFTCWSQS
jgi:hypothetical protein